MRKKVLSAVLAATMVAGMMGNVVSVSAEEKYDLTLYSVNTTDPDFDDWLANVEEATGLNINVIAAPTDTDTRQQKITTILSTGDSSVDIVEINDEMSAAFKNSGWLEGLNDTVMTDDIIDQFAQGYIQDMITDKDGNIVGVPGYTGYLAFWVNQEIMDEVGIESIDTKEDFMKYMEALPKDRLSDGAGTGASGGGGGPAAVRYLHHWEGRCRGCAGRGHDSAAVLVPVLDRTGDHPFCWLEKQGIRGALSVHGTGSAGLHSGA